MIERKNDRECLNCGIYSNMKGYDRKEKEIHSASEMWKSEWVYVCPMCGSEDTNDSPIYKMVRHLRDVAWEYEDELTIKRVFTILMGKDENGKDRNYMLSK